MNDNRKGLYRVNEKPIVVITNGNFFARIILHRLIDSVSSKVAAVLIVSGDYKARTGLNALWNISKVTALPYLIYKIFVILIFSFAEKFVSGSDLTVRSLSHKFDLPVLHVADVNSSKALSFIAKFSPDLIVSVSCPQMIKTKVLSLARFGGINVHSSLLPDYAGLAPYYWVLSNGEKSTGTSIHYMSQKFDEGNLLVQKGLNIEPGESAFNLFYHLSVLGCLGLLEAVDKALSGDPGQKQDMACYSYYSHPDMESYRKLRRHGYCLIKVSDLVNVIRFCRTKFLSSVV